ncbi:hypothetical protein [Pseudorhodobacter sp. MZDSW-24AT]|uniref:hypothetical protein n=1 Tax=Pseudorhodobacter sp. MZDSW-24AT TaxID=2052957 RepID=UPI0012FE2C1A|nr:hypothetical protein [Pseudorhodobacter sp. MZDSW-24AT]
MLREILPVLRPSAVKAGATPCASHACICAWIGQVEDIIFVWCTFLNHNAHRLSAIRLFFRHRSFVF